jgi:hypothetical protein
MVRTFLQCLFAAVVLSSIGLTWMVVNHRLVIPEQWNPFSPLNVTAPPGPLTSYKFWRATQSTQACMAALQTSTTEYRSVKDSNTASGCALRDVVRVARLGDTGLSSSFMATCPLALGLSMVERHVLQPEAQNVYGHSVVRLNHVGSYACRNIDHEAQGQLSEHAFANAIDLDGFVLSDGTVVSIGHDWARDGRAGDFLQRVHRGACNYFHVVLGPDYNALHRAHFHLDMGRYRICS